MNRPRRTLRELLEDDKYASTFRSIGEYRGWLLSLLNDPDDAPLHYRRDRDTVVAMTENQRGHFVVTASGRVFQRVKNRRNSEGDLDPNGRYTTAGFRWTEVEPVPIEVGNE